MFPLPACRPKKNVTAYSLLFDDLFNGASAHLVSHTPDVGVSWEMLNSCLFDLDGLGNAVCSDLGTGSVAFAIAHAAASFPTSATIDFDSLNDGNDSTGIVFNYVDDNNYWRVNFLAILAVEQVSGGSVIPKIASDGTGQVGSLVYTPTRVTLYSAGILVGSVTRSAPAGTKIGLFSYIPDATVFSRLKVTS